MPSFSTTVVFLLFLVMTTTTVGGSNDLRLGRKIKHSKKTNANANTIANVNTCLLKLLGKSQYTNCAGTETELDIACANKDTAAAAAADSTLTERLLCSYSEHPVQYEDEAAAATTGAAPGCGVHGSFDPWTHITLDHATGVCRLKFVALIDSCDAAPAVAGDRFGVMVEAPSSIGPGSHNHEQNEDNHHKDNSGLLLRFSTNAGLTYYNNQTPRNTIPLDNSSPRRTLNNGEPCVAACPGETFDGTSQEKQQRSKPFHTCYRWGKSTKYCWTKSYKMWYHENYNKCVPNCWNWGSVDQKDMRWVNPATDPYSCGDPCQEMHQHGGTDPCR